MLKLRNKPPVESLSDKAYRNRGVLLVVLVPLGLVFTVLLLMPGSRDGFSAGRKVAPVEGGRKYAVVFDAGSSGSRVHVFCFDRSLNLVPIGNDLELFEQIQREGFQSAALDPVQETTTTKPNSQIRYRSPSATELLGQNTEKMLKLRNKPPVESLSDKAYRNRGVLLVVLVPLGLVFTVLLLMPGSRDGFSAGRKVAPVEGGRKYAVVFDAGSSGSRVHVFCFDRSLNLVPIGNDLELFEQIKPGLSAYAKDPKAAAESLQELLVKAQNVVPKNLLQKTPVRVGATAGLRQLEGDASDRILEAVSDFLKDKSPLKSKADSVTVLDGTQEGAYQWVTINYLLGKLGKRYSDTVGVVDLGGGSVQMAYAISEADAAKAPRIQDGEDTYVKEMYLKGTKYYLYVHSYLHYGLLAARAEILKVEDSGSPCIMMGYQGSYKYGGTSFPASAPSSGSSVEECRRVATKALKVNESTCTHMKCTFGGVWNGGGGDGQKNLFVASFFFDRAAQAGFANPDLPDAKVSPVDFEREAKRACQTKFEDAQAIYPHVDEDDLPYLCMDLVYQYTLLVDGFGLDPWQKITLVKKVKYQNSLVEAAWPLGSAIEVVSSLK